MVVEQDIQITQSFGEVVHGIIPNESFQPASTEQNEQSFVSLYVLGDIASRNPYGMVDLLGDYQLAIENLEEKTPPPQLPGRRQRLDDFTTASLMRNSYMVFDQSDREDRSESARVFNNLRSVIAGRSSQEIAAMKNGLKDALLTVPQHSQSPEVSFVE